MLQLIIPAYDEEARLPRTLTRLRSYVTANPNGFGAIEVVVVDNASTDRTAEVAAAASSLALPVSVVTCSTRGKGAAVRAGIAATHADIVGFMDADGATSLSALDVARRNLVEGADLVIGSRGMPGAVADDRHSLVRRAGAAAYRSMASRLVPGVRDTQCGFKLMRGDLGRQLFAELHTTGFSFDVELIARAVRRGVTVAEIPVEWSDIPGSRFDPIRHGMASFQELRMIGQRLRHAEPRGEARGQVVDLPQVRLPLLDQFDDLDPALEA